MNRIFYVLALVACSLTCANAETFSWTDKNGVLNFTDDPGAIPAGYRNKVKKSDDITIRNPRIQQELKEQEELARRERSNQARTPRSGSVSPPPPATVEPAKSATDELPAGRTRSQKIRDNIERREAEEKAR